MTAAVFQHVNLVTTDIDASIAFYRSLGLPIEGQPGALHVELVLPNGMSIEWDDVASVPMWDSGWTGPGGRGHGIVLGLQVATRAEVDATYADLRAAGHLGHQPPFDAFWGSRYAIVEDPDGNCVGLMSPIDDDRKYWPPAPAPHG